MIGKKYGKLTVLKLDEKRSGKRKYYICQCECGNLKSVRDDCLKSGNTKSCGCLLKEINNSKTQYTKEKLYHVWAGMKSRCNNPNTYRYEDYGGRGIKVCDEWNGEHNYVNFRTWAINNGYSEGLTIDRINVNGNYEPNNCRWVNQHIQSRNTRRNLNITYNGETHVLQDWSEILNININTLYHRIYILGWDIKEAFENHNDDNYKHGLDKANEKNKQEYEEKCNKIITEIKKLNSTNVNYVLNIIKEIFNIKSSRTIYKCCCGTQRKKDFVNWLKNL